jgi:hypothetical protein
MAESPPLLQTVSIWPNPAPPPASPQRSRSPHPAPLPTCAGPQNCPGRHGAGRRHNLQRVGGPPGGPPGRAPGPARQPTPRLRCGARQGGLPVPPPPASVQLLSTGIPAWLSTAWGACQSTETATSGPSYPRLLVRCLLFFAMGRHHRLFTPIPAATPLPLCCACRKPPAASWRLLACPAPRPP